MPIHEAAFHAMMRRIVSDVCIVLILLSIIRVLLDHNMPRYKASRHRTEFDVLTRVRRCLSMALSRSKERLDVVVSPDWDGIVSTCIVAQHAFGAEVNVIATYDAHVLRAVDATITKERLQRALWIDIDQRFPGVVHCVGQHFLGNVAHLPDTYVNPNEVCTEREYTCKYPLSTAMLLLYGLGDESDLPGMHPTDWTEAHAAIAHTDSCVVNSFRNYYQANVAEWGDTFHSDTPPRLFEALASNTYHTECEAVHRALLRRLSAVDGLKKAPIPHPWRWDGLKHQILRSYHNPSKHFCAVKDLLRIATEILGTPSVRLAEDSPLVLWKGDLRVTKPRVFGQKHTSDFQYHPRMNMEDTFQKLHPGRTVASHAITYAHTCSITLFPLDGPFASFWSDDGTKRQRPETTQRDSERKKSKI